MRRRAFGPAGIQRNEKADKEIKKADELSKGNTKRLACIIAIVVIAIGVVLAIVLSLVL